MTICQCGKKEGSPDWNLFAWLEQFHPAGMEQTWTIGGAYARWNLTVAVEPREDEDRADVPLWALENFGVLADHFRDLVNLSEFLRDKDEGRELARALTWRAR